MGNSSQLILNAGTNNDTINIRAIDTSVTMTTVNGNGGDDTANVGSTNDGTSTLDDLGGPLTFNGGTGVDRLNVNDRGTTAVKTYTVKDASVSRAEGPTLRFGIDVGPPEYVTLNGGSGGNQVFVVSANLLSTTTVNAGSGSDRVYAGNNDKLSDILGPLVVSGDGGDTDKLCLYDQAYFLQGGTFYTVTADQVTRPGVGPITYQLLTTLELHGGGGGNVVEVKSTNFATTTEVFPGGPEGSSIVVGNDNPSLDDILGPLHVHGGGVDSLTLNDQASNDPNTFTITDDTIERSGITQLTYDSFRTLELNGGGGGNNVVVNGNGAIFAMTVNSGAGPDDVAVRVTPANSLTLIAAGPGDDAVSVGDVNNRLVQVLGSVDLDGGDGKDALQLNDQGTAVPQAYSVRSTVVFWDVANQLGVTYLGVESLTLNGGSGGNPISIESTSAGTDTRINSGSGIDNVKVASGPPNPDRLDDIQGPLTVDGQGPPGVNGLPGNNSIVFDDSGNPGPLNYNTRKDYVSRTGIAPIKTLNFKSWLLRGAFILNQPGAFNQIDVESFLSGGTLTIEGPGRSVVSLGNANNVLDELHGTIVFNGHPGEDLLLLNDQGHPDGETYALTDQSVAVGRLTDLQLTFGPNVYEVDVNGGLGSDAFHLNTPVPALALHGGPGYDTVVMNSGEVDDPTLVADEKLEIIDGTLTFTSGLSLSDLEQSGGTLTGSGTVTASSSATWTGGTMSGTGQTRVPAGGTLTISGAADKVLDARTLENGGVATWFGGPILGGAGTVRNLAGGSFSGAGLMEADLDSDGALLPGGANALGLIAVTGNFFQTGLFRVDLGDHAGDRVDVTGPVTLERDSDNGTLLVTPLADFAGDAFLLISNDDTDPVEGTFEGLPEGATFSVGGDLFRITYVGGDGNDVVIFRLFQANEDSATTYKNSPVPIPVLANDLAPWAASLSITLGPEHGWLTFDADGLITYSPNPGFTGSDSFTYELLGPADYSSEAEVTIAVSSLQEGNSGEFLTAVFHNPDNSYGGGAAATVSWSNGPSGPGLVGYLGNGWFQVTSPTTFPDNGPYTASTSATYPGGPGTFERTFHVDNVPPTIHAVSSLAGNESGQAEDAVTLGPVTFEDPGYDDPSGGSAETFTYTVDWGDGSTDSGPVIDVTPGGPGAPTEGSFSLDHLYQDSGVYTVTITVADDDDGKATVTTTAVIENLPPTPTLDGPDDGVEGSGISLTATATDPSPVDTQAGISFTWAVTKGGDPFAEGSGPSFAFTPDDNGSYEVTVTATDKDGGSDTDEHTVVVTNLPPSATLSGGGVTVYVGDPVTVYFTGPDDPSSVDLSAGLGFSFGLSPGELATTYAGASTNSSQEFTFPAAGTYTIYGRVLDKDDGSGDAFTDVTVIRAETTTQVYSSWNPSTYGGEVTFTAVVSAFDPSAGTPDGSVEFLVNGEVVDTLPVVDGSATFVTSSLEVGTHTITVSYLGTARFEPSSGTTDQVVVRAQSALALESSPESSVPGQTVTFTATVTAVPPGLGVPTGSVEFRDGDTVLGATTLDASGQASFSTSGLTLGWHTITARYLGDEQFEGSEYPIGHLVHLIPTRVTASSAPNPSAPGEEVSFTITVSPIPPYSGVPTGSVFSWFFGEAEVELVLDGNGQAFYTVTPPPGLISADISFIYTGAEPFQNSVGSLWHTINSGGSGASPAPSQEEAVSGETGLMESLLPGPSRRPTAAASPNERPTRDLPPSAGPGRVVPAHSARDAIFSGRTAGVFAGAGERAFLSQLLASLAIWRSKQAGTDSCFSAWPWS